MITIERGSDNYPSHWEMGKEIAQAYLNSTTAEDRARIATYCEAQGILAAIVCHVLQSQGHLAETRQFIEAMIAAVTDDEKEGTA